jgi:hypothetical protein
MFVDPVALIVANGLVITFTLVEVETAEQFAPDVTVTLKEPVVLTVI